MRNVSYLVWAVLVVLSVGCKNDEATKAKAKVAQLEDQIRLRCVELYWDIVRHRNWGTADYRAVGRALDDEGVRLAVIRMLTRDRVRYMHSTIRCVPSVRKQAHQLFERWEFKNFKEIEAWFDAWLELLSSGGYGPKEIPKHRRGPTPHADDGPG